jgi:hypothetical protein
MGFGRAVGDPTRVFLFYWSPNPREGGVGKFGFKSQAPGIRPDRSTLRRQRRSLSLPTSMRSKTNWFGEREGATPQWGRLEGPSQFLEQEPNMREGDSRLDRLNMQMLRAAWPGAISLAGREDIPIAGVTCRRNKYFPSPAGSIESSVRGDVRRRSSAVGSGPKVEESATHGLARRGPRRKSVGPARSTT